MPSCCRQSVQAPSQLGDDRPSCETGAQGRVASSRALKLLKPLVKGCPTLLVQLDSGREEGGSTCQTSLWEEKMFELELEDEESEQGSNEEEEIHCNTNTSSAGIEQGTASRRPLDDDSCGVKATSSSDTSKEDERIARELAQHVRQPLADLQPSASEEKARASGYSQLLLECNSCHSICGVAKDQLGRTLECPICRQRFRACSPRA